MDGCWLEEGWQQWADARRGERWRPVASLPPNPSSPQLPPPLLTKKTKDISAANPSGGGDESQSGFVSKCSKFVIVAMTDMQRLVLQHFVFFFFFFKAISWVIGSCFDYTTLTISLPGWLCCTVKDHRAVFPLPSAHPRTNMSTQTEKHCYSVQLWDAEHSLTSQHVELFGVFQISGDQIIFV